MKKNNNDDKDIIYYHIICSLPEYQRTADQPVEQPRNLQG